MRELTKTEITETSGGISLGIVIFAVITGAITGGPVGVGIALAGITGAQGIDKLVDLNNQ